MVKNELINRRAIIGDKEGCVLISKVALIPLITSIESDPIDLISLYQSYQRIPLPMAILQQS